MLNKIRFYFYFRKHTVHHPDKVFALLEAGNLSAFALRRLDVLTDYAAGMPLEYVAEEYNITRERTRQIINKFVRSSELKDQGYL